MRQNIAVSLQIRISVLRLFLFNCRNSSVFNDVLWCPAPFHLRQIIQIFSLSLSFFCFEMIKLIQHSKTKQLFNAYKQLLVAILKIKAKQYFGFFLKKWAISDERELWQCDHFLYFVKMGERSPCWAVSSSYILLTAYLDNLNCYFPIILSLLQSIHFCFLSLFFLFHDHFNLVFILVTSETLKRVDTHCSQLRVHVAWLTCAPFLPH